MENVGTHFFVTGGAGGLGFLSLSTVTLFPQCAKTRVTLCARSWLLFTVPIFTRPFFLSAQPLRITTGLSPFSFAGSPLRFFAWFLLWSLLLVAHRLSTDTHNGLGRAPFWYHNTESLISYQMFVFFLSVLSLRRAWICLVQCFF